MESADQVISLIEGKGFSEVHRHLEEHSNKLLNQIDALTNTGALSEAEAALVMERSRSLTERLASASRKASIRKHPLENIKPAVRRAYEVAIDTVIASSLPIAVRADLAKKIVRRATSV